MDTYSFIVYVNIDDIYKDIAEDFEIRFDTSNYELDIPLPKGKNRKLIELMNKELGEKVIKEFFRLRAKTSSYLIDDSREHKKAKDAKKCVIKRKLKLENYKTCLKAAQL